MSILTFIFVRHADANINIKKIKLINALNIDYITFTEQANGIHSPSVFVQNIWCLN